METAAYPAEKTSSRLEIAGQVRKQTPACKAVLVAGENAEKDPAREVRQVKKLI